MPISLRSPIAFVLPIVFLAVPALADYNAGARQDVLLYKNVKVVLVTITVKEMP